MLPPLQYRVYIIPSDAENAWDNLSRSLMTKEIQEQFGVEKQQEKDTLEVILAAWEDIHKVRFTMEKVFSREPEVRSYVLTFPQKFPEKNRRPFLERLKEIKVIRAWDQAEQPSLEWLDASGV